MEDLVDYWGIFFGVQYAFFLCPFRIKMTQSPCDSACSFTAVTWLPQKILCSILGISNIIIWIPYFIRRRLPTNPQNPSEYLHLLSEINLGILKVSVLKIFWFGQCDIVRMLNFMARNCISRCRKSKYLTYASKVFVLSWCVIIPTITIFEWIFFMQALQQEGGFWTWALPVINLGRKAFFLGHFTPELKPNESISIGQSAFCAFIAATSVNQWIFYTNLPSIILLQVITLWGHTYLFINKLNLNIFKTANTCIILPVPFNDIIAFAGLDRSRKTRWKVIKKHYKFLKKLAALINSHFGLTFSCFIIHTVLYYST